MEANEAEGFDLARAGQVLEVKVKVVPEVYGLVPVAEWARWAEVNYLEVI
jgi:hypothetical protein